MHRQRITTYFNPLKTFSKAPELFSNALETFINALNNPLQTSLTIAFNNRLFCLSRKSQTIDIMEDKKDTSPSFRLVCLTKLQIFVKMFCRNLPIREIYRSVVNAFTMH